jgi:hypothetical protein
VPGPADGVEVGDPLLPLLYPVGPLPTKFATLDAVLNLPDPVAVNPSVPFTV